MKKREYEHGDAEGRVQERASPLILPRGQVFLYLGLKNLSTRAVCTFCTFHTRSLSVNDHLLAGILGGKNVGTPASDIS